MIPNYNNIIARLTTLILILVGIIIVALVFIGYLWTDKRTPKTESNQSEIIDYYPPSIAIDDLKSYRRSANFLDYDFKPESGKVIFKELHCAACHSLDKRTIIGPGLSGLFHRVPSKEWLLAFMTEPDSTLNLPIDYSSQLRTTDWTQGEKRFHRDRIFDSLYTKQQIYDVLGYIGMKK